MINSTNTINPIVMISRNFFSVLALLLVLSCGGNPEGSVEDLIAQGNLEAIKEKRKALGAQERESQCQPEQTRLGNRSQGRQREQTPGYNPGDSGGTL